MKIKLASKLNVALKPHLYPQCTHTQTKHEPKGFVLSLVFYHFYVLDIKQMWIVSGFIVRNCESSFIPIMAFKM